MLPFVSQNPLFCGSKEDHTMAIAKRYYKIPFTHAGILIWKKKELLSKNQSPICEKEGNVARILLLKWVRYNLYFCHGTAGGALTSLISSNNTPPCEILATGFNLIHNHAFPLNKFYQIDFLYWSNFVVHKAERLTVCLLTRRPLVTSAVIYSG